MSILGTRVIRTEDPRLPPSGGVYVDDLREPELAGAVRATFVRSTIAHALITGIDTAAALEAPGVVALLTAADMTDLPAPPPAEPLPDDAPPPEGPAPMGGGWQEPLAPVARRGVQRREADRLDVNPEPPAGAPDLHCHRAAAGGDQGCRPRRRRRVRR